MPDSRIKTSLFITLLIACVFFILGGCGSEKFVYTDNGDGTCTITGYDYDEQRGAGKVAIPRKINGLTVTTIGKKKAFFHCKSIYKLTIPGTVTTIEEGAFWICGGLDHIVIPDSVTTIEYMAFYDSTLIGDLVIPGNVAEIGDRAFACNPLNSITVSEQNESFTSVDGVLYSKDMSVLMQAPWAIEMCFDIPDGVEIIRPGAFEGCYNLMSVTIPYGVTKIGGKAFYSLDLMNAPLPESLTEIGNKAFYSCENLGGKLSIPYNVTTIGESAFSRCDGLKGLEITGSMVTIGDEAFLFCRGLESITIQGSVDRIGNEAFSGCHRLARAEFLGDAPKDFGAEVFDDCSDDFVITYDPAKSGWSTPTYKGYPCFPKDADEG